MAPAKRPEDLAGKVAALSIPELDELRRLIDRRLADLRRAEGGSLIERLSAADTVELAALAVRRTGIRCRTLDTRESVTLRPHPGVRQEFATQILTVQPRRAWAYGRTVYLSGAILDRRIDAAALGLTPLTLEQIGAWQPERGHEGATGEPPRPSFRMESILPGFDPKDPGSDPILRAVELAESEDWGAAHRALGECLEKDPRALDAHAHLGEWKFDDGRDRWHAKEALPHFEAGTAIGELSLGPGFQGVLSGAVPENRPFLRCLRGLGLCRWALGDTAGAREAFSRLLQLDPDDAQGVRPWLREVSAGAEYAH